MEKPRALFVDDEVSILNAIRRGLRPHCRDWQLEFCHTPEEALSKLAEFDPWVIISDKRMPGMDGIEFLSVVRQQSPQVVRVLLTADSNENVVLSPVNTVHLLLPKPFDPGSLVQLLQRVRRLRKLPISSQLRQQLGAISSLPVLPEVYQQLTDYLQCDATDAREVARIISQDPSILAKVMQLANSAFFGFSSQAVSPHDAVVRLGVNLITSLVLCLGVFKQCEQDSKHYEQLLNRSLNIAKTSRQLSIACGCEPEQADASFTLGLLHQVGLLVTPQVPGVIASGEPKVEDAVGAYLLALWGFETDFIDAVMYQSSPEAAAEITSLSCRLHVAKVAYSASEQGLSTLDESVGLNRALLQSQGLLNDAQRWIEQIEA